MAASVNTALATSLFLVLGLMGPGAEIPRALAKGKRGTSKVGLRAGRRQQQRKITGIHASARRRKRALPRRLRSQNVTYRDVRAGRLLLPRGIGGQGAVVAANLVGMGVPIRTLRNAERKIPSGKWPGQRWLVASIMAAMEISYEQVASAEASIPAAQWAQTRAVLGAVLVASKQSYAQVKAFEQGIAEGEWKQGDQRIVVAALARGFGIPLDKVRTQLASIPEGALPEHRAILAADLAAMEGSKKGLAPEDRRRLERMKGPKKAPATRRRARGRR